MLLKWLREKLRSWLLDEQKSVDTIECLIEGKIVRAAVESVCGMSLSVSTGQGSFLVSHDQAVNKQDFWRAWSQRSSNDYVWEDGDPFRPEGN